MGKMTEIATSNSTFRWFNPKFGKSISMGHGKDDGFDEFLDLLIQPTNVIVILGGLFINLHGLYTSIISI